MTPPPAAPAGRPYACTVPRCADCGHPARYHTRDQGCTWLTGAWVEDPWPPDDRQVLAVSTCHCPLPPPAEAP